jgi:hypothetical protein
MNRIPILLAVCLTAATPAHGGPESARLRLHLDCGGGFCDLDHLRQQLDVVDWVRDRRDADVAILVTSQPAGSGGTERVLFVARPRGGGPPADTLRLFHPAAMTESDARDALLHALEAILARDLIGRPGAEGIHLTIEPAPVTAPETPARDPWNAWVLQLGVDGALSGEQAYRSSVVNGALSASRITEPSKVALSVGASHSRDRYDIGDGTTFVSTNRAWSVNARAVKSLGGRWSAGGRAFALASTFANVRLESGAGPAIELDLFPYAESSRRLLTIAWDVTGRHVAYHEETLFGKTSEVLWRHGVHAKLAFTQQWGSAGIGAEFAQYLHDRSKHHATLSGGVELRLARGLSLSITGHGTRIRDQLGLRRGDATIEDVIARRRQLATSYEYSSTVGLSYSLGSIFNDVVNLRLNEVFGAF